MASLAKYPGKRYTSRACVYDDGMAKVLVVDDDKLICSMIADWLSAEHYQVEFAHDGKDAKSLLENYKYDAVILDWGLPEISGVELCQQMRFKGLDTPILMLTGRDLINEKEMGLDSGADDYLTKPFHMKELSARLRAILRRSSKIKMNVLSFADITLDPVNYKVTKGGENRQLLPKEFQLLEYFMRHPNEIFSAESLLDRVWKSEANVGSETVRTCITRLRKKIDNEGQKSFIENLHGVGYRFREPE